MTRTPLPAVLLAILLGLVPTGLSGQVPEVVDRALVAAEAVRLDRWAFTVTRVVDGVTTVERHDPSAPKDTRWVLVERNGRAPSEKERQRYVEERGRRGFGGAPGLRDLIEPGSLAVVSDEGGRVICSFRMKADDEEDRLVADKVRGTLIVRKDPAAVERLEVVNTGTISKFGVLNLREFLVRVDYRMHPTRPEALPETVVSRIRGRALVVKSLDAEARETYSDFRWVGP